MAHVIIAAQNSPASWKSQAVEICPGLGQDELVFNKYSDFEMAPGKYEITLWQPKSNTQGIGHGTVDTEVHLNFGSIYIADTWHENIQIGNFKLTGTVNPIYGAAFFAGSFNNIYVHPILNMTKGASHFFVYANRQTVTNITYDHCISQDSDSFGFLNSGEGSPSVIDGINYLSCEEYNAGVAATRTNIWVTGFDFAEYGGMTVKNLYAENCKGVGAWESVFHCEADPIKINFQLINCQASGGGQKPNNFVNGDGTIGPQYGAGFLMPFQPGRDTFIMQNCSGSNNKLGDLRLFNYATGVFDNYTPIPKEVKNMADYIFGRRTDPGSTDHHAGRGRISVLYRYLHEVGSHPVTNRDG